MSVGELNRTDRFVNTLLLVLMTLLGVSGVIMLYGAWLPWLFDLHRMAGFAVVALLPWKGLTIYRSYLRGMARSFDRSLVLFISLFLAHLLILVIILGIMWMFRWGPYTSLFFQTIIAWHWIIGLALLPVLAFHAWRRWPSPRVEDFSGRKDFLRLIGLAAVGVFGGGLASRLAVGQATPESPRRFTASRGFGMFTGNDFPLTGEAAIFLNERDWRLKVSGASRQPAELTYAQLLALDPQTRTEVIDCTSGWYSVQDWSGLPSAGSSGADRPGGGHRRRAPGFRNGLQPYLPGHRSAPDLAGYPCQRGSALGAAWFSRARGGPRPAGMVLG